MKTNLTNRNDSELLGKRRSYVFKANFSINSAERTVSFPFDFMSARCCLFKLQQYPSGFTSVIFRGEDL